MQPRLVCSGGSGHEEGQLSDTLIDVAPTELQRARLGLDAPGTGEPVKPDAGRQRGGSRFACDRNEYEG
jgi:hypothetical protein